MLSILRKHQRILMTGVAGVTIASFCFFGTASSLSSTVEEADRVVAVNAQGDKIWKKEVDAVIRFLTEINSSFLENDLLRSGLGTLLFEKYADELDLEFKEKMDKVQAFQPYVHPQFSLIRAQELWNRFTPELLPLFERLKKEKASTKAFDLYSRLYLSQLNFPPELLHKFLSYQMQQAGIRRPDASFSLQRVALFGFLKTEEWFGPKYLEKVAIFIIESARMAEKKECFAWKEEVRASLLEQMKNSLQAHDPKKSLQESEIASLFQRQCRTAGLRESEVLNVGRKILLSQRLFERVGQGLFLDPLSYEQFAAYTGETAVVDLYQLPSALRLNQFETFLRFQCYLDLVAPKNRAQISKLPTRFYSVAEMEKRCPELVQVPVSFEYVRVTKEEIGERLSLKETWDWEISEKGFNRLKGRFPSLQRGSSVTKEERRKILEEVAPEERLKIDVEARYQIIDEHAEWIAEALSGKKPEKFEGFIRLQGACYPFHDIEEGAKLLHFLQKIGEGKKSAPFSLDGKNFYAFTVLKEPQEKEVLTFQESLKDDWMGEILQKKLEEAYAELRRKDAESFQTLSGAVKPLSEVIEDVGSYLYQDILQMISSKTLPLEHYASLRLKAYMEEARRDVIKEGDSSLFLQKTGDKLRDQWILSKQQKRVRRSDKIDVSKEELFHAAKGAWLKVSVGESGALQFAKLHERQASLDGIEKQLQQGQKMLSMDASRLLMQQIMDTL